jgi:hypothetical protein
MALIIDRRIVNLSSNHGTKENGTYNSSISFSFPDLVRRQPDIAFVEVGVINAEIPVSFYNVNETNYTMRFTWRDFSTALYSAFVDITLAFGNYTATTLIAEIKSKMLSAISGFTTDFLILSISKSTGKLVWDLNPTGGGQNVDGIRIYNSGSTCFQILGGDPTATYFEFFNTTSGTAITYPLNLLGINKINIQSNQISTFNYDSGRTGFSNILASIEVDAPPYGVILYKNSSLTYNILSAPDLDYFTIDLRDVNDNSINFNNQDWSITLGINLHRTPPSFSQSTFNDILANTTHEPTPDLIKPPPPLEPAEDIPIIKNEFDLLNLPIR